MSRLPEELYYSSRSVSRNNNTANQTMNDGSTSPPRQPSKDQPVETRLLKAELSAQSRLVSSLRHQLAETDTQMTNAKRHADKYEDGYNAAQERIAQLESELLNATQQLSAHPKPLLSSSANTSQTSAASKVPIDEDEVIRAIRDAQEELRRKDVEIEGYKKELMAKEGELSELAKDIASLEADMSMQHRKGQKGQSDDVTPRRMHSSHQNGHGLSPIPASAEHSLMATLQQLTSPGRRIDEEFGLLQEQLRLKQQQVVTLEGQLGQCLSEKSVAEHETLNARAENDRLHLRCRELETVEVELRAQFAVQQDALEERSGIVDLLKKEFAEFGITLTSKVQEAAALRRELEEARHRLEELDGVQTELERERRMSKAARDVLKLREQEIATLNDSLGSMRRRSLSPPTPPLMISEPVLSQRTSPLRQVSWQDYSTTSHGQVPPPSAARESMSIPSIIRSAPPSARPSVSPPNATSTTSLNHSQQRAPSHEVHQQQIRLREENNRLKNELLALQDVSRQLQHR